MLHVKFIRSFGIPVTLSAAMALGNAGCRSMLEGLPTSGSNPAQTSGGNSNTGGTGSSPSANPSPTPTSTSVVLKGGSSSFVPTLNPSDLFPPGSIWTKDVSNVTTFPASGSSPAIIAATKWPSGKMMIDQSIVIMQVNPTTPVMKVQFTGTYSPDSDTDTVEVPVGGALEGETGYTCTHGGDCHLLVADTVTRKLYELWTTNNTSPDGSGTWSAVDQTTWLMDGHYDPVYNRGLGCTSADAAGLSVAAGLIGLRETKAGAINHAIRFALANSVIRGGSAFVAPGTHYTGAASSSAGPPYGTRFRLHSSFNVASLPSPGAQAIARAMQKYGMLLADGANFDAIMTESDQLYASQGLSWSGLLGQSDLSSIKPSDFDVVDFGTVNTSGTDCIRAPSPPTTPPNPAF